MALRNQCFSVPDLRSRDWTPSLITCFLGLHDDDRSNPFYREVGAPMRLYLKSRVLAAEATEKWQTARERSLRRRAASANAVATKTKRLLERIEAIEIPLLTTLSREELFRRACEHYNARLYDFDSKAAASLNSDEDFLNRIALNYLRHECSGYEAMLQSLRGKTGRDAAYQLIRKRTTDAILRAYPFLRDDTALHYPRPPRGCHDPVELAMYERQRDILTERS